MSLAGLLGAGGEVVARSESSRERPRPRRRPRPPARRARPPSGQSVAPPHARVPPPGAHPVDAERDGRRGAAERPRLPRAARLPCAPEALQPRETRRVPRPPVHRARNRPRQGPGGAGHRRARAPRVDQGPPADAVLATGDRRAVEQPLHVRPLPDHRRDGRGRAGERPRRPRRHPLEPYAAGAGGRRGAERRRPASARLSAAAPARVRAAARASPRPVRAGTGRRVAEAPNDGSAVTGPRRVAGRRFDPLSRGGRILSSLSSLPTLAALASPKYCSLLWGAARRKHPTTAARDVLAALADAAEVAEARALAGNPLPSVELSELVLRYVRVAGEPKRTKRAEASSLQRRAATGSRRAALRSATTGGMRSASARSTSGSCRRPSPRPRSRPSRSSPSTAPSPRASPA